MLSRDHIFFAVTEVMISVVEKNTEKISVGLYKISRKITNKYKQNWGTDFWFWLEKLETQLILDGSPNLIKVLFVFKESCTFYGKKI